MKRILIATDFSQASEPALRRAIEMAREDGTTLLIAHVLEPPVPFSPDGYVLPRVYDEMAAVMKADAEKRMRRILALARKARRPGPGTPLARRASRSHRARRPHAPRDSVVVGTHGRRGFSRLFLGSVAARVVATSPCPVLVVPAGRKGRRAS